MVQPAVHLNQLGVGVDNTKPATNADSKLWIIIKVVVAVAAVVFTAGGLYCGYLGVSSLVTAASWSAPAGILQVALGVLLIGQWVPIAYSMGRDFPIFKSKAKQEAPAPGPVPAAGPNAPVAPVVLQQPPVVQQQPPVIVQQPPVGQMTPQQIQQQLQLLQQQLAQQQGGQQQNRP